MKKTYSIQLTLKRYYEYLYLSRYELNSRVVFQLSCCISDSHHINSCILIFDTTNINKLPLCNRLLLAPRDPQAPLWFYLIWLNYIRSDWSDWTYLIGLNYVRSDWSDWTYLIWSNSYYEPICFDCKSVVMVFIHSLIIWAHSWLERPSLLDSDFHCRKIYGNKLDGRRCRAF